MQRRSQEKSFKTEIRIKHDITEYISGTQEERQRSSLDSNTSYTEDLE